MYLAAAVDKGVLSISAGPCIADDLAKNVYTESLAGVTAKSAYVKYLAAAIHKSVTTTGDGLLSYNLTTNVDPIANTEGTAEGADVTHLATTINKGMLSEVTGCIRKAD